MNGSVRFSFFLKSFGFSRRLALRDPGLVKLTMLYLWVGQGALALGCSTSGGDPATVDVIAVVDSGLKDLSSGTNNNDSVGNTSATLDVLQAATDIMNSIADTGDGTEKLDVGNSDTDIGVSDNDSMTELVDSIDSTVSSDVVLVVDTSTDTGMDVGAENPDVGWSPPVLPDGLTGKAVANFPLVLDFAGVVNSDGAIRTINDLVGTPTVLWFYPAASTSG